MKNLERQLPNAVLRPYRGRTGGRTGRQNWGAALKSGYGISQIYTYIVIVNLSCLC